MLALSLFRVTIGWPPPSIDASILDLVSHYYNEMYNSEEILGFLLFVHHICISRRTLFKILKKLGLNRRSQRSPVTHVISKIRQLHQRGLNNLGYRQLWRILNVEHGLSVSQMTVRNILRVHDPEGVALRTGHRLRRRKYANKGPNYVIHIDGYDKLKPFGIAIHGAVDGFSRKILWLVAGPSNNDPRQVAYHYINLLRETQRVPRLIRSDCGTENGIIENIQIALRMNDNDSHSGFASFSKGRSTSNQRIEMIWSILKRPFTQFWRNFFKDMVDENLLDNTDPIHIQCIRFCFLGVIQRYLDSFRRHWNSHRLRSQRHSEVVTGIPDVLYQQPLLFGTFDFSSPLPCDLEVLGQIEARYTEVPERFGCCEDFRRLVSIVTYGDLQRFRVISTPEDAKAVYRFILELLNEYH